MISSLKGLLAHKDHEGAIVECAGVGYGVAMSMQSLHAVGATGREVRLHIYTHVAEDTLRLYGFVTADERRTFEVLLNTSGVGPRLALAILSTLAPEDLLTAVSLKDRTALTRIPGVGPKKADRLLLELSGRLAVAGTGAGTGPTSLNGDVISALTHLGFDQAVAQRAAQEARASMPGCEDVATLTRHALQRISHRPKGPRPS